MRRLIEVLGTALVLVVMAVGCDGERGQFDPADKVGPSPNDPDSPGVSPMFGGGQRHSSNVNPTACGIEYMPETGCPRGHTNDQYADNGYGLELLNRVRASIGGHVGASVGWQCLINKDAIMSAAIDHAKYHEAYMVNGNATCLGDGHTESPGCSFFTGEHHSERIMNHGGAAAGLDPSTGSSENVSSSLPPQDWGEAICDLFHDAPFHRQSYMRSEYRYAGVGTWYLGSWPTESSSKVINWVRGADGRFLVAYWPRPGAQGVKRFLDASSEVPTPPVCAGGWGNCGYAVSINDPGAAFTGTAFCKVSGSTCTHVPHKALLSSNFPDLVPPESATLYAEYGLEANTVYRVQFFGTDNGASTAPWWEFRTGTN